MSLDNAMPTTTGLILTYNGEHLLDDALKSLAFCDELLIVDSGSTDKTLTIAKAHDARVVYHPFENLTAQLTYALTLVSTDWVVNLDQDESLSPELAERIQERLAAPGDNVGFYVRRRSFYIDRFLLHGGCYPDYLLRVFRHGGMEIKGTIPFYEFYPKGKAQKIKADIVHYPYKNLQEQQEKSDSYINILAAHLNEKGRKGGVLRGISHALFRVFRRYIMQRGFLDGRAGLVYSFYDFIFVYKKYVRLGQLNKTTP